MQVALGLCKVCKVCARFVQGLCKVCAGLRLREMWFLRQGCLTVCDQGESSRTKLVAIVDGLAAGSPYSLCVYPPTSWPFFRKFVINS